jgi:hypothetical protein
MDRFIYQVGDKVILKHGSLGSGVEWTVIQAIGHADFRTCYDLRSDDGRDLQVDELDIAYAVMMKTPDPEPLGEEDLAFLREFASRLKVTAKEVEDRISILSKTRDASIQRDILRDVDNLLDPENDGAFLHRHYCAILHVRDKLC